MATLTREQLLSRKRPKEKIEIPSLGGEVWVLTMASDDKDSFEHAQVSLNNGEDDEYAFMKGVRARYMVRTLGDENGERLLSDDDAEALSDSWNADLENAFSVAKRLNGITAEDIKELAKNSATDPKDSSGTT